MANKVDLCDWDSKNDERQVQKAEIENFAKHNNLMFVGETSAKEDINIKETFEELLTKVHGI